MEDDNVCVGEVASGYVNCVCILCAKCYFFIVHGNSEHTIIINADCIVLCKCAAFAEVISNGVVRRSKNGIAVKYF